MRLSTFAFIVMLLVVSVASAQVPLGSSIITKGSGSGSSSGNSTPGMTGTTASDQTLRWIYDQTHFSGLDTSDWLTVYISSESGGVYPLGSDSNDGLSPETAFQTIQGLLNNANGLGSIWHRVELVMDEGDTWTCAGSSCVTTDSLGPAFSGISGSCQEDEPCVLIRSSDRTGVNKPTLACGDVETDGDGPNQGLLRGSVVDDAGWFLYENLAIDCDDGDDDLDLFRPDDAQNIIGIGLDLRVAGQSDQMATAHGDGVGIMINTTGFVADDGVVDTNGEVLAPVNDGTLVMIGNSMIEFRDTDTEENGRLLRAGTDTDETANLWVIGHLFKNTGGASGDLHIARVGPNIAATNSSVSMVLAQVGLQGVNNTFNSGTGNYSSLIQVENSGTGSELDVQLYQVTLSDASVGISVQNTGTGSTSTVTARGLLVDGLNNSTSTSSRYTVIIEDADDLANTTWDIQASAYDDDEGGVSADCSSGDENWFALGTEYQCLTDFLAAVSVTGTFFNDAASVELGDLGDNVAGVRLGVACNAAESTSGCMGGLTSDYTVDMPTHPNTAETITIPAWAFGSEISAFNLNSGGQGNIGAR